MTTAEIGEGMVVWGAHDPAPHVSARLNSALLSTAPNVSAAAFGSSLLCLLTE